MGEIRSEVPKPSRSPAQGPEPDAPLVDQDYFTPDLRRTVRGPLVWIIAALILGILFLMIRQLSKGDLNGGDATIESVAPPLKRAPTSIA